jgi:hypothetical protein
MAMKYLLGFLALVVTLAALHGCLEEPLLVVRVPMAQYGGLTLWPVGVVLASNATDAHRRHEYCHWRYQRANGVLSDSVEQEVWAATCAGGNPAEYSKEQGGYYGALPKEQARGLADLREFAWQCLMFWLV